MFNKETVIKWVAFFCKEWKFFIRLIIAVITVFMAKTYFDIKFVSVQKQQQEQSQDQIQSALLHQTQNQSVSFNIDSVLVSKLNLDKDVDREYEFINYLIKDK